jgi:peptidase M23-like protein
MTPVCIRIAALLALVAGPLGGSVPSAASAPSHLLRAPEYGSYAWPLQGRVIRGFEPPPGPYDPGHRGIDIAAPFGTDVGASREGIVAFAGWVAGDLYISIDHADGVRTTYSWLSEVLVKKGQSVARTEVIGRSGHGHPDVPEPHLHFGARVGSEYIDPMLLLEGADVADLIHLAPLTESMTAERQAMAIVSETWAWMQSLFGPAASSAALPEPGAPRMGGLELWGSLLTRGRQSVTARREVGDWGCPRLHRDGRLVVGTGARAGADPGHLGVVAGAPGRSGAPGSCGRW